MRISATQLESFRLFKNEDWFTEEKFVNQITGEFIANPAMNFGTAYHRFLEYGFETPNCLTTGINDEYPDQEKIDFLNVKAEVVKPALEFRKNHPYISNEVKIVKDVEINEEKIQLVVKADGLEGLLVHEHKTTINGDFEKYSNSYQWRLYALLFDCDVQYNIFRIIGSPTALSNASTDQEFFNLVEKIEYEKYNMSKYADLENDCFSLLSEFIYFINLKGLQTYFKDKVDNNNLY